MAGFDPFPTTQTDNLVLRRMAQTDLHDVYAMRSDPRMHEHTDTKPDQTHDETRAYIERMDAGVSQGKWIIWAMEHQPSQRVVGSISIWNLNAARASGELGFGIIPEFQGRGLMREALSRVVDFGFGVMGLQVIEAYTEADNGRARRLLEGAGFTAVDTIDEPGYSVERVFHMVGHRLERVSTNGAGVAPDYWGSQHTKGQD